MIVYIDLVLIINVLFDSLLLMSTSIVLKRNTSFKRILLGSLVGGLTIFILFIKINNFILFIIKLLLANIMMIVTFSYKNFKYFINNLIYFYMISMILGGTLYLINNEFNYINYGLVLIKNKYSVNILLLLLLSPLILFFYLKQLKKLKMNYNNYYKLEIVLNNQIYKFNAYLDSGNKLKDQYKKRPITIVSTDKIKFSYDKGILVPYVTVEGNSILKCLIVDKMIINNEIIINNALIGLSDIDFKIDGVDALLNNELLGG